VLGPKIPEVNEYHKILAAELSKCVAGKQSPEEACNAIKKQTDNANDI
jgi:multiple sugar transport system substrate-binding protein